MITIQKSKDNKVLVTFTMPPIDGCDCLYLVGKFYDWNESVYRMQRAEDGVWSLTLELEPDHKFQYCFRTNDGEWLKDPSPSDARHRLGSEISLDRASIVALLN